jgi:branched-chain amino acid transport system ATP-binding protein
MTGAAAQQLETGSAQAHAVLSARILTASYGAAYSALHDVELNVRPHEAVAIVGANGAGKSTLMRSLMGMIRYTGEVHLGSQSLDGLTTSQRTLRGLVLVPENKALFPSLSVDKHLYLAATAGRRGDWTLERVLALFPSLVTRRHAAAGTLSGGEQQMLAIARALLLNPKVLLLDEPSLGLAPAVCEKLFETLRDVCRTGLSVVLNEQNARYVLGLATRVMVLRQGRCVFERAAADIHDVEALGAMYLK